MLDVKNMPFEERLGYVILEAGPYLGPEAKQQLRQMVSPAALKMMAGILGGWVVGHAFGYGEAIDIILAAVGAVAVGFAIFTGLDELYEFASLTYKPTTENDLKRAGRHLAKAITILSIQAVMALLMRRAPKTKGAPRGKPPNAKGWWYKPKIIRDPTLPAGRGFTTAWGNIRVSTAGTEADQALVLLHERVHQILTPTFRLLRRFRVEAKMGSYVQSSLYRFVEEAMAEAVAQIGVNGLGSAFIGIRFPVAEGYVFLMRAGASSAFPGMAGAGVLPEAAGILATGMSAGFAWALWFRRDSQGAQEAAEPDDPEEAP